MKTKTICITDIQHEFLKEKSKELEMTDSELIRRLLEKEMEKDEKYKEKILN